MLGCCGEKKEKRVEVGSGGHMCHTCHFYPLGCYRRLLLIVSLLVDLLAKECCRRAACDTHTHIVANLVVATVEDHHLVLRGAT